MEVVVIAAAARQAEQKTEVENDIKVEHETTVPKTRQYAEEMGINRSLSQRTRLEVCTRDFHF